MSEPIDLSARGIRIWAGWLYNHDFLWFSSFEISKRAATAPVIHSYALSYALSGYTHGVCWHKRPRYAEDLEAMLAYATPARPGSRVSWTQFTQNAVNSRTLRTDDAPRGINSPALGWRVVLDPLWRREGDIEERGFSFYVFGRGDFRPPPVVRLGKKGCPVRLVWEEIERTIAFLTEGPTRPTHAVNPLDVQGRIVVYEPVPIPPHLVLRMADIARDWFIFSGRHRIHVPRRFVPAEGVGSWQATGTGEGSVGGAKLGPNRS